MLDGDSLRQSLRGARGRDRIRQRAKRQVSSGGSWAPPTPEWERGSIVMSLTSGEGFVEKVKDDEVDEEQGQLRFGDAGGQEAL